MKTNHYAFYSILAQQESVSSEVYLEKYAMETYLTDPEEELELNFVPPRCGQKYCQNVKYFLI